MSTVQGPQTPRVSSDMEKRRSEEASQTDGGDQSLKEAGEQQAPVDVALDGDVPKAGVATADAEEEPVYVTGYQLVVVIAVVCMASFIMLLDTSIVATVSRVALFRDECLTIWKGVSKDHDAVSFPR